MPIPRIVGVAPVVEPEIVVDDYVPLRLRWPRRAGDIPLYWSCSPDERSLVEIGFEPEAGSICDLTIVNAGPGVWREVDGDTTAVRGEQGLPCCDPGEWVRAQDLATLPMHYLRGADPIRVALGASHLALLIGAAEMPMRWLWAGRVRFGIARAGSLCQVRVEGFTTEERVRLGAHAARTEKPPERRAPAPPAGEVPGRGPRKGLLDRLGFD